MISIWVVYDHPLDFPDKIVARRWDMEQVTDDIIICDTLDQVRAMLPPHLYRLERMESDDPAIIEAWI